MDTSNMHKLQLLCTFIKSKGVSDADTTAAADGLEASLVGVPDHDTIVNEKGSFEPSTRSSGGLRLVDLVLRGVLELARKSETALSTAAGGKGQNGLEKPEDLKQQLYVVAVTITAVADCWERLTGKDDDSHRLAVATAATTSGVCEALEKASRELAAQLSDAPDNKKLARSPYLKLAVSIISLWHSFVEHWTTAGSILVGSDMAMFSQSVLSLIYLLLRALNKAMQSSAAAASDPDLLSAFSTAMDGCTALARCIAKNYTTCTATESASNKQGSGPAAAVSAGEFDLHDIFAKTEVPALFALGAGYHIWMLRKSLQDDILSRILDSVSRKLTIPILLRTSDAFKELLMNLQLTALGTALVKYLNAAWASQEESRQQELLHNYHFRAIMQARYPLPPRSEADWQPQILCKSNKEDDIAFDVISCIASVCDLANKPAIHSEPAVWQQKKLQQQQQVSQWLAATSPLLVLLSDLQLSISEHSRETIDTAQCFIVTLSIPGNKALRALDALIAIWSLQLSQTDAWLGVPVASTQSSNTSSLYKQIISSMSAIEESIRSAAAVTYFAWELLSKQALHVNGILAAHSKQLQGVSVALDKSVWSLTLTSLKLAQAYSTLRTADAALLAQHMLKASLQLFPQQADAGTASQATAQQQKSSHAAKQSAQHVDFALMMIGRISSTIGTILQHTGRNATSDRYKQELKHTQLSSVLAAAAQLSPWLDTTIPRIRDATMPLLADELLSALRQQLQKLDAADDQAAADASEESADVSDTDATDQSQDTPSPGGCHAKGLALARLGAALSSEFPIPYCCNNPDCVNMALESELMLVRQKGSVCSACQKARYCSKACQKQHWKQHKPVCKKFRSAAA